MKKFWVRSNEVEDSIILQAQRMRKRLDLYGLLVGFALALTITLVFFVNSAFSQVLEPPIMRQTPSPELAGNLLSGVVVSSNGKENALMEDIRYYRLRITAREGLHEHHHIVGVEFGELSDFSVEVVSDSEVEQQLSLRICGVQQHEKMDVRIVDKSGKVCLEYEFEFDGNRVRTIVLKDELPQMSEGLYYVVLSQDGWSTHEEWSIRI